MSNATVCPGSGPKNSTFSDVVWPRHNEMVSHPKFAVGTGLRLLFVRAVLMLKNL